MKFTSKKTVSEVVIDFEDGCVIKLTKSNCYITEIRYVRDCFGSSTEFDVELVTGLKLSFRTIDENLSADLRNLQNSQMMNK